MILEKIKTLIRDHDICVLATMGADGPHTSLMAYVSSADGTWIYLVTSKESLKYRNLTTDARVSLLVDTREADHREAIQAVTITGSAHEISDAGQKDVLQSRIKQHLPHLQGLMAQPDIALIGVRIQAFQLLDGVQDAHYIRLPECDAQ